MTSTPSSCKGADMRLELDCPIHCSDGLFGELADVVIDPTRRRVTHLVVEPRHGPARLVPAELARGDAADAAILLSCTADEARDLPTVADYAYLRLGEFPVEDPRW